MIHVDKNLAAQKKNRPKVKIKSVVLDGFTKDEIFEAAKYIADSGLVDVYVDSVGTHHSKGLPRNYRITGFTNVGQQYLHAVYNETAWKKLKRSGILEKLPALLSAGETLLDILKKL